MSTTTRAVKHQNASNEAIARETNQLNYQIASEANDWNYRMFTEQNDWNYNMWKEQNAYNDPSAQMERYLKAGVNPLWAISGGDPGNASQVSSAASAPAEVAKMEPWQVQAEYDPTKLNNIVAASRDVVNSLQGFQRLALESQDVDTRKRAQNSQEILNHYDTLMKKALTAGYNTQNAFNTETFGARVSQQSKQLELLQAQYDKTVAEGKNAEALHANILAGRDLIHAEISNFKSQVDFRLSQIESQQRSLDIAQQNADTNSSQVSLARSQLKFDKEKWQDQLSHWNNDEIFRWATSFASRNRAKGSLSVGLGTSGVGINGAAEYEGQETFANFEVLQEANVHMFKNCQSHPTQQNIDAYQRFDNYLKAVLEDEHRRASNLPSSTIPVSSTMIFNPNSPWNQ